MTTPATCRRKAPVDAMRPGDVWRHNNGMGRLAVTGEPGCKPGYLKCFWMMTANANAPWTCLDPRRTEHFTLISRMCPDD